MSNNEISARFGTDVVIRMAGPGDANALATLRYEFRSSFGANCEDEDGFVERSAKWMQDRLHEAAVWRCWIAECDGVAAGNIWAQLIEKIPNPMIEPERLGYITNFYVRENYRNCGLGSQLFSAAMEWIKESDVDAVILWPTERSRSFYRREGFSETVRVMEMRLDPQHI
ncbi:MAG TPA: GNAT family N-acetyltransferase [Blastocatellia bacterium]|nr:GNAT family N-acetyltransferase [Blastocatellia bacterium]